MKTSITRLFMLAACTGVILVSCKKEDKPDTTAEDNDKTVALATAKVQSDVYYDDISQEILKVNTESGLSAREMKISSRTMACATVNISPAGDTWPKTVTVDFGNGCTGDNGFVRKGKVIYTLTKKLISVGAVLTITFENYSVNNYKLEGIYSVTNNEVSLSGIKFTTKLINGKIIYPDGKWFTRTSEVTWAQTAGAFTPTDGTDDEFNLSGTGIITSSEGNSLTATTKTNLLRKATCYNLVSGKLGLVYNSISGTLDYGNGDCDKNAVLTIGTKDYAVTLP